MTRRSDSSARRFPATCLLVLFVSFPAPGLSAQEVLTIDGCETAGISMFRAHWDTPIMLDANMPLVVSDTVVKDRGGAAVWTGGKGPIALDALNRSLLVRFPDAAEKMAQRVRAGATIAKLELVLTHKDEEIWPMGNSDYIGPEGYSIRKNWGTDKMYQQVRPRWHAVAWALKRPWKADPQLGPTFNASIHGAVQWTKYGAQGADDRVANPCAPAEVSYKQPEGRIDLTAVLADPALGATLAARLRTFADAGLLVKKLETYDAMYFISAYEWNTATGGRAIIIGLPKLIVTFGPGKTDLGGELSPPADIAALAAKAKADGTGGRPTAVMPSEEDLQQFAACYAARPPFLADWQWERVRQLASLDRPAAADEPFWFQFVPEYQINRLRETYREKGKQGVQFHPAKPERVYAAWVDALIGRQPRGWSGFESAREMTQWYLYKDALPAPARDAIQRYWSAWLMPDRETAPTEKDRRDFTSVTGKLIHPMAEDPRVGGPDAKVPDPLAGRFDTYWSKTGDWRGNKSFFRSGFCYTVSTQNFNTTAAAGALLGGAMIDSERAMADGRKGVEHFPLRLYCWSDGSGQEHIDHYYFAVTLSGNKALADFSATPYDRLIGQSLLAKNVEELVSAYHPALRTFIAGSARTSPEYLLGTQDGLQFILHTLSRARTLRDLGESKLAGNIPVWGHEVPAAVVARQTLAGPWAPAWIAPMVDNKPLPYYARHTMPGGALRTCYMGENYGLFSTDTGPGRIQTMAQWRRDPSKPAASARDLATLDVRFGINDTRFVNDAGGWINNRGSHSTLQHKNKLLFLASPKTYPGGFHGGGLVKDCRSMQSSIGLFTLQDKPTWELFVDGQPAGPLPITARQGQKITLKDGATYLAVIPLPATDLGRDAEVVIEAGKPQASDQYKTTITPTLVINSYNLKQAAPLAPDDKAGWLAAAKAYSGFIIELGDQREFGSFEAFQKQIADAKLDVNFAADTDTVRVKYASGPDTLDAASRTFIPAADNPLGETGNANFVSRTVNGQPFGSAAFGLPAGIERDTPYCQQAIGRAEKNGASLEADAGRRIFLLTEPKSGVYCAWNPLPDLTHLKFTIPGGPTLTSRGKVGLTRITARPGAIEIDHAFKPGQESAPDAASALLLTNLTAIPEVTLNGTRLTNLAAEQGASGKMMVVPLR